MKVSFLDLKGVNEPLSDAYAKDFQRVLASGWYIQGQELAAFEAEFAEYSGVEHCVGTGTGLDAIHLLLEAYGIGPGDEVIVPSNTFIATWLAVTRCGATPVAAEPDPRTYNVSSAAIEAAITPRTKAIIPVHLYGQPADMDSVNVIAKRHGLWVIEDAAQSHGARYRGQKLGCLSDAAATSFYPGKNLGALGDGGAILTNDKRVADRVKELRNYGSPVKYQHDSLGFNSRLDELQAALLRSKLKELDKQNDHRRVIAERYTKQLDGLPLITPFVPEWAEPSWHLYVIRSQQRDQIQQHLKSAGIETMVHYPIPPHKQKCYAHLNTGALPIAEKLATEILSLPIHPAMPVEQVDYVIEQLKGFYLH
ncbi:DegT/DnrJ/EryC1/StrS family aminotransferase [Pseudomonas mosselii]|uniref:DegT/DnrJ/EryC1/StrS family aminotransferase n=1 Tax=Pseudomonas mosselii TaxID=78327 RepID=UPI000BB4BDF9|nr:DegT/DnrJ/EryC1/StrS family aminotransferase [Pseudomonas mosselii]ATB64082.1 erythromycin biosynthesis sensory transduction protein eryC1 [Pseudomonas mosselii]MDH1099534.1 DegT/DnrJ/EryC1/StrS family aminotransferase [Pseudomonas mosselii]